MTLKQELSAKRKELGRFKKVLGAMMTLALLERPGDREKIIKMIFDKDPVKDQSKP